MGSFVFDLGILISDVYILSDKRNRRFFPGNAEIALKLEMKEVKDFHCNYLSISCIIYEDKLEREFTTDDS